MPRAVRFDKYGGLEVLQVVEVDRPTPAPGKVLVRVKAAGINPGEASIRKGMFADRWPSTFPSGQGSDLAGIVEEVGPGVANVAVGDEVIGFTNDRASQAEFVLVESAHLVPLIGKRGHLSEQELASFIAAGFTKEQVMEVIASGSFDNHKLCWNHRQSAAGRPVPAVRLARVAVVRRVKRGWRRVYRLTCD
jgi:NADPH:quinone reductase-like Zn-dependent oxidoreductase